MATKIHHPKGSMCAVCRHKATHCGDLPFSTMPVMKKYASKSQKLEYFIIKCSGFEKD